MQVTPDTEYNLRRGGICALVTCGTASVFFGIWPWSTPSLDNVYAITYVNEADQPVYLNRIRGTSGNGLLNEAVEMANHPQARVLATGRVAAHLLQVERLELVGHRLTRDYVWRQEVPPGQPTVTLFDFIVIDFYEHFHQSPDDVRPVFEDAMKADFKVVFAREGVILLRNPSWPRNQPGGASAL
jgi:hypothetical protein